MRNLWNTLTVECGQSNSFPWQRKRDFSLPFADDGESMKEEKMREVGCQSFGQLVARFDGIS